VRVHHFLRLLIISGILLFHTTTLNLAYAEDDTGVQVETSTERFSKAQNQPDETIIYVPSQVSNLQTAINQIDEGGIIEIAEGTYYAPLNGFQINNLQKGFTLQAAPGAQVTLDGSGSHEVLRFVNTNLSFGRPITFRGVKFFNGYTNTAGLAAGVTLYYAEATFVQCTFQNNIAGASANSGGVFLGFDSKALFIDSIWINNRASQTGGGLRLDLSAAYIHNSKFINNRTNFPYHSPTSSGGAISVINSMLRVSDTRFENNQAGYVAGGIYALGTWTTPPGVPQSEVVVSNSTFINNLAQRDQSVSYNAPTEGGAFHVEAQSTAKIYHSRFVTNRAMSGGAITIYQANLLVDSSIFQGNQAMGTGSMGGYGGAISVSSNDVSSDGSNNRPAASLTIQNSLIQGRYGSVTTVGQGGGGIYIGGDLNRMYGWNGVSKLGTLSDNRAHLFADNVIFYDLDVSKANWGGMGGCILVDLVDLTLQDSLLANCDASGGNYSSGGGLAGIDQSLINVINSVIAKNTSSGYGGGFYAQGSTFNLTDSIIIENSIIDSNYGSAIFTAPQQESYGQFPIDGVVQGCTISNNDGLPIFDDDRTWGPINDVRYNNNTFYHNGGVNAIVYSDAISTYSSKTVSELNSLVVVRSNGTSTPKSQVPNTALASIPNIGGFFAAPGEILIKTASGDSEIYSPAYLGYAWSGASATLDGIMVSSRSGVDSTNSPIIHTFSVGSTQFSIQVSQATQPTATFTAFRDSGNINLNWSVSPTTFLDSIIDQGVSIPSAPSGSVQITGDQERVYYFYAVTQEWGVARSVNSAPPILSAPSSVNILTSYPPLNHGGFIILNIGGCGFDWTAETSTPELLTLETTNGQTQTSSGISFTISTSGRPPGQYIGYIQIDAGDAGSQMVTITIYLVASPYTLFLPLSSR